MSLPNVSTDFYPLGGGLDLVTPAIAVSPGKILDSQNYEPAIGGGYSRISGFERYDGQASPTSKSYWLISINLTGTIVVGNTVTGLTSAATGVVVGLVTGQLVLARVSGTFNASEALQVAAVTQATSTSLAVADSANTPTLHADYKLLAANDWRTLIGAITGSGRIRGVWVYNDVVYAFRDNAGGTAKNMWKATSSGWVQVSLGKEIQFTGAVGEVFAGDTITGLTSGATATVVKPMLRTGSWTVAGAGTLILSSVVGTFQSGEALRVVGVTRVTSSSLQTNITLLPGGIGEYFNYNFAGSTNTMKMYGCDGVNLAFEFDGTNYIPIRTGMTADTPTHIMAHRSYLFLSFLGSVQYSGIGNPYAWTVVLGAGELNLSQSVSGFLPQSGNSGGASLAIFTTERTFILYGSSSVNFSLVPSVFDLGFSPYTMQQVSNDAFGLTARGIQRLMTTLNYGDFDYGSVSHMIQPLMTLKRGLETTSCTLRTKNQYRVYFSDSSALAVGLTGDNISGITVLNYGIPVRCMVSTTLSTGAEVTYFGSDSGYVYLDNTGTSFDGAVIESWMRLPFNNNKSPRVRKRFRRAIFELSIDEFCSVNITYDLGYGNPDVSPAATQADQALNGSGGFWDSFTWDRFSWDSQSVSNPSISIDGTEKNISLTFYSSRAQDKPHTIQGVTLLSTPQRLERS